jgi:hypothetical protein
MNTNTDGTGGMGGYVYIPAGQAIRLPASKQTVGAGRTGLITNRPTNLSFDCNSFGGGKRVREGGEMDIPIPNIPSSVCV